MEPFPLLAIPHVPLRRIVDHVDPVEVVRLALCHEDVHAHLSCLALRLPKLSWNITPEKITLELEFESTKIVFIISTTLSYGLHELVTFRIHGKLISGRWVKHNDQTTIYMRAVSLPVVMTFAEAFSSYLFSIYNLFDTKITHTFCSGYDIPNLFVWKYSMSVLNLSVCRGSTVMSRDEFTWIMENLKPTIFFMDAEVIDFKYRQKINASTLHINNVSWVDMDDLLSLDVPIMKFTGNRDQAVNFNALLRTWMAKKDDDVESVLFITALPQTQAEIFQGIEATPTQFRPIDLRLRVYDWQAQAFDITRPTDGRIGTVLFGGQFFQFLTWKEHHYKFVSRQTRQRMGRLGRIGRIGRMGRRF
uniref:F-box domain-containing protein n=1 Tax=Caenorhabditis tropicalis TaxID=1561998 RepID=A0A1I7TRH9_9PELO